MTWRGCSTRTSAAQLLQPLLQVGAVSDLASIDAFIVRWARRKFKRLRQRPRGARNWLARVIRSSPGLFAHWPLLHGQGRTLGAV
jgi:RNA-directed DNA polymerase